MKKFFLIFLALVAIGAAGFLLGWAQLNVPHGSYGVVRSKTHGIDPQIIKEGEFRWIWYKLIPTNVKIQVFTPKPMVFTLKNNGSLPSGAVYSAIAGIQADFSWEISTEISFSVRPEALPSLCKNENINSQDDLNILEQEYARRMEAVMLRYLDIHGNDEKIMEEIMYTGSLAEASRELERTFTELENINCVFRALRIPDYELYKSVRQIYNEYLAFQKDFLENDSSRNSVSVISTRLKFDELEKYGEILTRYPVLLQLLAIDRGFAPGLFPAE